MGLLPRVARAALHFWEEPCISGKRGSGAVFFSGCTLRCAFCQNYEISHLGQGKEIPVRRLADIFRALEDQGAHNINLVTATPFAPAVLDALSLSLNDAMVAQGTAALGAGLKYAQLQCLCRMADHAAGLAD